MAEPFLGQVVLFGGNFAPYGWALCNGQILPIAQYAALFSLLGTNYGGNGTSNFGLPNLQGRAPICFGQGSGLSDYVIGQDGGAESVKISSSEMPAHTHAPAANNNATLADPAGGYWAADSGGSLTIYTSGPPNPQVLMDPTSIAPSSGGQAHENRPPFLAISYIIALSGLFPTRP